MRFATVHGVVVTEMLGGVEKLHLKVFIAFDHGQHVDIVRDEALDPVRQVKGIADLCWHADQWTQETLGIKLAREGWEAIGVDETVLYDDSDGQLGTSATYFVRRMMV
jgi:hypothetical protein